MKRVYSARNSLNAHDARLFLENNGVPALVANDNSALEVGFSFTPASAPGVFVAEDDLIRAAALIELFTTGASPPPADDPWKCGVCGQSVDGQFHACWRCEAPRYGESSADADSEMEFQGARAAPTNTRTSSPMDDATQDAAAEIAKWPGGEIRPAQVPLTAEARREAWLEVTAVAAVAWFPYLVGACLVSGDSASGYSFVENSVMSIAQAASIVVVILYIMHRSELPWAEFGIERPRLLADLGWGAVVWAGASGVVIIGQLLVMLHFSGVPSATASELGTSESGYEFQYPATGWELIVMFALAGAIGLSEELAMRGYLIPRLESLLNSTIKSVLLSSLLFASYHIYQGIGPTLLIGLLGLCFGIAFCYLRRLWPLLIAHAAMDIEALWPID